MPQITVTDRSAAQTSLIDRLIAVTPSDDTDISQGLTKGVFVSGAGDLKVRDSRGNEVTLASGASQYHPIRILRVLATGTTATGVVALY